MISIRISLDRWTKEERGTFLLHVGDCLEKGFLLKEALILQQAEARPLVKKQIQALLTQLEEGQPIADGFASASFSQEVTTFLHFSSYTGSLSKGFKEAGNFLIKTNERQKRIGQLLRYPLFLFWLLLMMGIIMVHDLLPNFKTLYSSMSITLPRLSLFLLAINDHLLLLATVLLLLSTIGFLTYLVIRKRLTYQNRLKLFLSFPFLSSFLRLNVTSIFATHFGSLLKIGMPVNVALEVIGNQAYHPFLKDEAIALTSELKSGKQLSSILSNRAFYTRDLSVVVANGSVNGRLGETLVDYSQILHRKLETKLNHWILFIQPLFFFIIGGALLVMFLSIFLPMFDLMKGL